LTQKPSGVKFEVTWNPCQQ